MTKKKEIKLTKKQKGFCDDIIDGKSGTQSALNNYDTEDYVTAASISTENLKKPQLKAYLDDKGDSAGAVIEKLMNNSKKEEIKLGAAKFVYEHAHGKASQKITVKEDEEQFEKGLDLSKKSLIELDIMKGKLLNG